MKGKKEMRTTRKKKTNRTIVPVAKKPARKLSDDEKVATARRSRKRGQKRTEAPPALDVSIPAAHPGTGYRVAETFVAKNDTAILDIVVPDDARVVSWCCYARPAKSKSKRWHVVAHTADAAGRLSVPVPRTHFYVWSFGEAPSDAAKGESVYRLYGHNIAYSGVGRDVCWRLILQLAPKSIPVSARAVRKPTPGRKTGAKVTPPPPKERVPPGKSVPIPA